MVVHLIFWIIPADHIQPCRSPRFSRRPNLLTLIWSVRSSSLSRIDRPNPKLSSRGRKAALDCPSTRTVSRFCKSQIDAFVDPRTPRVIESGVQYYSNSLTDGSGFKKKIHGGDGHDEKKPGGGYDKACAAFLEFHEVSDAPMVRRDALFNVSDHPFSRTPHSYTLTFPRQVTILC